MSVLLNGDNIEKKREEIRLYFHKTFDFYEKTFEIFKDDTVFYEQPESTRHPLIFYFGHTAAFFVNKLILMKVIDSRINQNFESIFAIGVDEMNWDDLDKKHYKWPTINEVKDYRNEVRNMVDNLISTLPLFLPLTQTSPWWIILMGIEHENIHIETSSVLHRQLPIKFIQEHKDFPICEDFAEAPKNEFIKISGKKIKLGKDKNHHLYGWDNEYGQQDCDVNSFQASKFLCSNGEFLEFVKDDGYTNEDFWDDEGILFLKNSKAKYPSFWIKQDNGSFLYRALTKEIPLPLNFPVEINYLEASAFCKWKTKEIGKNVRLLSEEEWYVLYEHSNVNKNDIFDETNANINFSKFSSSMPVDSFDQGDFYDIVGNVWQWSETHMDGIKGFEPHSAYDDFSIPTFDTKHNILKGGSWASRGNEITKHSRYAFRRHFFQHAGFRYIIGDNLENKIEENIYESDNLVSQYCEFQYGDEYFGVSNFAKNCAKKAISYSKKFDKALDLGCATGRATYELAKKFDAVTGIDFSARFIQVASALNEKKEVNFKVVMEGNLYKNKTISLQSLGLENLKGNVGFWQGDACNLQEHFSGYDLIMATNLIDRLYEPKLFLEDVHNRLNENGVLVLTSPYTWLEEYTKKENWLGGFEINSEEISTLDGLKEVLDNHFEFVCVEDVPFAIRETSRKFQHTVSQMSVWKKIKIVA